MKRTIGFVGTGNMGRPIAENLLDDGHDLQVYNRTGEKAKPLADEGAALVNTPRAAAQGADVVVTVVSDDEAVREVTLGNQGVLDGLGSDTAHLVMSTVAPATARELAPEHQDTDALYAACPVFGRPDAAANRQLAAPVSGSEKARKQAKPVLRAVSRKVYDLGEDVGAANAVKLGGNFMIAGAIEAMGEAFTFAESQGIERRKMAKIACETLFSGPIYENYGKLVADHDYAEGGFSLENGAKDVRLTVDTAREDNVPMPLANLLHERFLTQLAHDRGDLDWAALGMGIAREAGYEPEE
jgi:3-hydroxyisobutyrate dehydrogenase-like beta-hydroxyacid dehydrogenase